MLKTIQIELIASVIVISVTLAAVLLLGWLTGMAKRGAAVSKKRPECRIRIYYQTECECFERLLDRLISSSALQRFDTKLAVVDCVGSPESWRWLCELQKKHDYCFEIRTKGGGGDARKLQDDNNIRDG